jgi:hypothetical protein
MTILPTNISLNITHIEEISSYDVNGAIIYICVVLVWYAIGFGFVLIDDINPQPGRFESHKYVSVYQTVSDLHEHQARNDILVELKNKDKRMKLWQIYYGTEKNHPVMIQKDEESIALIIKQLNELNERRRTLRNTLNEISIDQDDDETNYDDSDNESVHNSQIIRNNHHNKSIERFESYFK